MCKVLQHSLYLCLKLVSVIVMLKCFSYVFWSSQQNCYFSCFYASNCVLNSSKFQHIWAISLLKNYFHNWYLLKTGLSYHLIIESKLILSVRSHFNSLLWADLYKLTYNSLQWWNNIITITSKLACVINNCMKRSGVLIDCQFYSLLILYLRSRFCFSFDTISLMDLIWTRVYNYMFGNTLDWNEFKSTSNTTSISFSIILLGIYHTYQAGRVWVAETQQQSV